MSEAVAGPAVRRQGASLDELVAHPERAREVPIEAVLDLLQDCAAAIARYGTLRVSLLLRLNAGAGGTTREDQQLLNAAQVAQILGRSQSWVEHNLDALPPRRSLCGQPLWLRRDVERWVQTLPSYGDSQQSR